MMKHLTQITLTIFILSISSCSGQSDSDDLVDPVKDDVSYELVWSDEFDTDGVPDPKKWAYENGFVRNEELQWYQSQNAFCENGLLVIEGKRDTISNPYYESGSADWRLIRETATYTSASVTTKGLHTWTYGRFEIKAKIITKPELWPAIWTLGANQPWPEGGEIDILEYYDQSILANAAWAGENQYQAIWDDSKWPMSHFDDPDFSDKFHIWRMDWDEAAIRLYLDDKLLVTIQVSKASFKRYEDVLVQ